MNGGQAVAQRRDLSRKLKRLTGASSRSSILFHHIDNEHCIQILSFVGGFIDAFGYIETKLFLSSITANIVTAASSIVAASSLVVVNVGIKAAVAACFVLAAAIGAFLAVRLRSSRDVSLSSPFMVSICLFAIEEVFLLGSMVIGVFFQKEIDRYSAEDEPHLTAVACVLAASMGFQAIAVAESITGAPGTTVITGNLITFGQYLSYAFGYWLAQNNICFLLPRSMHHLPERSALLVQNTKIWTLKWSVSAKPLVLFCIGCVLGALLAFHIGFWALVVPITLVGFILFEISAQFISLRMATIDAGESLEEQIEIVVDGGAADDDDDDDRSTCGSACSINVIAMHADGGGSFHSCEGEGDLSEEKEETRPLRHFV